MPAQFHKFVHQKIKYAQSNQEGKQQNCWCQLGCCFVECMLTNRKLLTEPHQIGLRETKYCHLEILKTIMMKAMGVSETAFCYPIFHTIMSLDT